MPQLDKKQNAEFLQKTVTLDLAASTIKYCQPKQKMRRKLHRKKLKIRNPNGTQLVSLRESNILETLF